MNFFEHQDRSRRQTRWLVFLFILAVLAIIVVVDLVILIGFGLLQAESEEQFFSMASLQSNAGLLTGGAIATGALIGFASLFKTLNLRGGGGAVAQQLGGQLVEPDTRDPLKRRLVNVVEEIALASGVPVPEIYVLEQEAAINAFAAGYSPADAAVAVTRGTLEKLDRNELQGVIAHEFSHILNGDMRLNIRLMGALFGILLLALIGRRVLLHSHLMGRSRDNSGMAIIGLAMTLLVVGYVGQFFGRAIKSAVSRQREYLADASAVQFTRDPGGIAGALKKIAINNDGSYLNVDSEEVGHMLFGPGQSMHLLATHPPLFNRILRVDPGFQEEELQVLAARLQRSRERELEKAREEARSATDAKAGPFDAGNIIEQIGNPDMQRILVAAAVLEALPGPVSTAAHAAESAPETILYSVLHVDAEIRELQLLAVAQNLGSDAEARVRQLAAVSGVLHSGQRLPLLEIGLPALHRQPPDYLMAFLKAVDAMIHVDGRVDVFEYLLARLIRQYLWESTHPHRVRPAGRQTLKRRSREVTSILAILAQHGHPEDRGRAQEAFQAGMQTALNRADADYPSIDDWITEMDAALDRLDVLSAAEKQRLVQALMDTTTSDGELVEAELELLRAICAAIHVPIPALGQLS